MVQDFVGASDSETSSTAIYVGILDAVYPLGQFLSFSLWVKGGDRIGRRPCILMGVLGTGITILLFGFSFNLPTAITIRFLCGSLNGNNILIKTYLSEILANTNQRRGRNFYLCLYSFGMLTGPLVGGKLSMTTPLRHLFTGTWFVSFPYLLPNMVCSCLCFLAFLVGLFLLKETHPNPAFIQCGRPRFDSLDPYNYYAVNSVSPTNKIYREKDDTVYGDQSRMRRLGGESKVAYESDSDSDEQDTSYNGDSDSEEEEVENLTEVEPLPYFPLRHQKKERRIVKLYKNNMYWSALTMIGGSSLAFLAYQTVFPLWAKMPRKLDGYNWKPAEIGYVQGIGAAGTAIMQLLIYPVLVANVNRVSIIKTCYFILCGLFLMYPLLGMIPEFMWARQLVMIVWQMIRTATGSAVVTAVLQTLVQSVDKSLNEYSFSVVHVSANLFRSLGPLIGGAMFYLSANDDIDRHNPFLNRYCLMWLCGFLFAIFFVKTFWFESPIILRDSQDPQNSTFVQLQHALQLIKRTMYYGKFHRHTKTGGKIRLYERL